MHYRQMKSGLEMDDAEYLPLSWLSQADYCLRRAALLMNERIWVENDETAKGRTEHERVHTRRIERRGNLIKLYEYEVTSEKMMLSGKCDCIEANRSDNGCMIPDIDFPVELYPVEYKHGSVRDEVEYKIQLCAQAMALEEMYGTYIPKGDIFFITAHKRQTVELDEELRNSVKTVAEELHRIRENFSIPLAQWGRKCEKCSLKDYCMPKVGTSARAYCRRLEKEAKKADEI